MKFKKLFLFVTLIFFILVTIAADFSKNYLPGSNKIFQYKSNNGRAVLFRQYDENGQSMMIEYGSEKYNVRNLSYIKTDELQPYYFTLPEATNKVKITFQTPQKKKPKFKRLEMAETLREGIYENTNKNIYYKGSWVIQKRDGPSNEIIHTSIEKDSEVSFSFEGSALEIGLVKYDDRITLELCIDKKCEKISTFSEGLVWQSPYLKSGLNNKKHYAELRLIKGKALDLDWVRVISKKVSLSKDNAHQWKDYIYESKGWGVYKRRKNSTYRSPRGYSKIAFDAYGKELALEFLKTIDGADVEICINNKCNILNFINFTPKLETHKFKLKPNVQNHITITKKEGRFIEISDIKIN